MRFSWHVYEKNVLELTKSIKSIIYNNANQNLFHVLVKIYKQAKICADLVAKVADIC